MRPNMLSTQLGGIANLALLAEIRPGFVEGFETVTHARRLEVLLRTLNAIRLASRESAMAKSPFPDSVGRFGILHSFRYAVVPPEAVAVDTSNGTATAPSPGAHRLSLNVTFDGGWEPYIRVIYRDLGTLLDAIFCNCVGYRASRSHSFDEYTRWVREHEVAGGLFYTESSMTVLDQRYLEGIEKIHREESDPGLADAASTAFALQVTPDVSQALGAFLSADKARQAAALRVNLKALKALHDLRVVYPKNADDDDQYLLRFSRRAMREFVGLLGVLAADDGPFKAALGPFQEAIRWITTEPVAVNLAQRQLKHVASNVQAGIVSRYDAITHGCLVLLRVTDAAAARRFLANLPVSVEGASNADDMRCNVAFTLQGLEALEVPAWQIDLFPQEFIEGMETRAGLLGDVRTNHPNAWRRPTLRGVPTTEIELASVHVVVQYRLQDDAARDAGLHPRFTQKTDAFDAASGLSILSIEAMRSYPEASNVTKEHFGFQDGISQPKPDGAPPSRVWNDGVARGEVFLGYPNDRGDGPYPTKADVLLDDGSFLVLRKIRQRVDVLDAVLKQAFARPDAASAQARIDLKERMMGRRQSGQPLVPQNSSVAAGDLNDFNYASDPKGSQCPFHSHARRTNPRTADRAPRIIRRGMSYGPRDETDLATERGVYFMAFCASIAEQFEVIQRWVAAGNSSGLSTNHSDPFLGVPLPGDRRVYRFLDAGGKVSRVELGDRPFTELQWGMYLFVPSVIAIKKLGTLVGQPDPDAARPTVSKVQVGDPKEQFKAWQRAIEDPGVRDTAWARVKAAAKGTVNEGTLQTDYGLLIADAAKLTAILNDSGVTHSVGGYGRRLAETIGRGYLGLDPDRGHTAQAETPKDAGVNQAIADITSQEAFTAAAGITTLVLKAFSTATGQPIAGGRTETPVDIALLSEQVLGRLCSHWFGLPDAKGEFMQLGGRTTARTGPARCPGHFFSVARYVFWPHPSPTVTGDAQAHGRAIRSSVDAFLKAAPTDPAQREKTLGKLSFAIESRLKKGLNDGTDDLVARTIAGTMLGFPPTVHGNFVRVMRAWLQTTPEPNAPVPITSFWNLQAELIAKKATQADHAAISEVLRKPLLGQMRKSPVPEVIWREAPNASAGTDGEEPPKTVLSIVAVMQDDAADDRLMFGGARTPNGSKPDPLAAVHACPGYEMAIGVMLGMIGTLLLAGTIRPTASSTIVNLVT